MLYGQTLSSQYYMIRTDDTPVSGRNVDTQRIILIEE